MFVILSVREAGTHFLWLFFWSRYKMNQVLE